MFIEVKGVIVEVTTSKDEDFSWVVSDWGSIKTMLDKADFMEANHDIIDDAVKAALSTKPSDWASYQIRAEFEDWAQKSGMSLYVKPGKPGKYHYAVTEHAWRSWQASRASLCVELPEPMPNTAGMDIATGSSAIGFNHCLAYTRIALNKAGVKYK